MSIFNSILFLLFFSISLYDVTCREIGFITSRTCCLYPMCRDNTSIVILQPFPCHYCEDYDDSKWKGEVRENELLRNKSTIFMQMSCRMKRRNVKCMGGLFFHMDNFSKPAVEC